MNETVRSWLSKRWLHYAVISLFVVLIMYPELQTVLGDWALVGGLGPIVGWVLGQQYERAIILASGRLEADELKSIERAAGSRLVHLEEERDAEGGPP